MVFTRKHRQTDKNIPYKENYYTLADKESVLLWETGLTESQNTFGKRMSQQ